MGNECIPYYEPGQRVSGAATADITGKTFVEISGAIPGGINGSGGLQFETARAGAQAFGVAAYDVRSGDTLGVISGSGFIVPVTAAAPIRAGQEVMVGANGEAVPYDAGGAIAASLRTGVVANNNAITWTAKEAGAAGNAIQVSLVDPRGTNRALSVDVNADAIIVSLATDGGGAITSTAAQVIAAIIAHDTASQKVVPTNTGASTGAGVVAAVAATNLAGGTDPLTAGRAVGVAVDDALAAADCPIRLFP